MKIKNLLAGLALLVCAAASAGEVFKWVDENGITHFSDTPPASEAGVDNTESVEIRVNSYETTWTEQATGWTSNAPTRVVMFSTSWCGYCRKAADYFDRNGIAFTEYDIEQSNSAKREFESLGGRGVPMIMVGDRKLNGFSESAFEAIYF